MQHLRVFLWLTLEACRKMPQLSHLRQLRHRLIFSPKKWSVSPTFWHSLSEKCQLRKVLFSSLGIKKRNKREIVQSQMTTSEERNSRITHAPSPSDMMYRPISRKEGERREGKMQNKGDFLPRLVNFLCMEQKFFSLPYPTMPHNGPFSVRSFQTE